MVLVPLGTPSFVDIAFDYFTEFRRNGLYKINIKAVPIGTRILAFR